MHREFRGKTRRKKTYREAEIWMGDNIKMDLREVACVPGDWKDFVEDRDQWRANVRAVMNLRVP